MTVKRLAAILLCALMLASMPLTAFAEQPESMQTLSKVYFLQMSETYGMISEMPTTPTFWEYPVLRAGEDYTEGTLIVRNDSNYNASMELDGVTLPYGNEAKMAYLNQLELVVTEGDKVLFDNTYAHINDEEGGLKIAFDSMAPGEEHIYTVKLRCRYAYAGDPNADASTLSWVFKATTQKTLYEDSDGLPSWVWIVLVSLGAMIVMLLFLMVVRAVTSKKKPQ